MLIQLLLEPLISNGWCCCIVLLHSQQLIRLAATQLLVGAESNAPLAMVLAALPAQVDAPPYSIANNNVRLPLSFRAIPVTARHYDGSLQYDTHNIYGLSQAAATYRALNSTYHGRLPYQCRSLSPLCTHKFHQFLAETFWYPPLPHNLST